MLLTQDIPQPQISLPNQHDGKVRSDEQNEQPKKDPPAKAAKPAEPSLDKPGGSGWFGGIFSKLSLKPKNQMKLPDDKNPTVSEFWEFWKDFRRVCADFVGLGEEAVGEHRRGQRRRRQWFQTATEDGRDDAQAPAGTGFQPHTKKCRGGASTRERKRPQDRPTQHIQAAEEQKYGVLSVW